MSNYDVDLHSHQPDPPNQCGCSTHEACREALRNRLLQKQSRRLAERRVSDPLPPGAGQRLYTSDGQINKPSWGLVREGNENLIPTVSLRSHCKPSVPIWISLDWVVSLGFGFALMLPQRLEPRNSHNYGLFARIMIKAKSLIFQVSIVIVHVMS